MIDWAALEAANAPLGAFVDWDRRATRGEGPLDDLMIGVKSNIAVVGLPWTAGMATRRGLIAERDAAVVARLRAAGAAIVGTLNMHEAALGATTDNPWYGRTHNPHRAGYTPGGSSGGSGAAVAAGLCDAALGTDTLGSVRIPAAYNGIYGLKPTLGAIDDDGLVPLDLAFDCIGPLARSLGVLRRVWRSLRHPGLVPGSTADQDRRSDQLGEWTPAQGRGDAFGRLVLLEDFAAVEIEPDVRAAYDRAISALVLQQSDITLPAPPTTIRRAALAQIGRTLTADLGDDRRSDFLSSELRFVLDAADRIAPDPGLLAATREALTGALGTDGVLLLPTAPQAAFAHGVRAPVNQSDFTTLASVAGLPALALPAGVDQDGLPVSVQLVGPAGSEDALIALAETLEPTLGGAVPLPY